MRHELGDTGGPNRDRGGIHVRQWAAVKIRNPNSGKPIYFNQMEVLGLNTVRTNHRQEPRHRPDDAEAPRTHPCCSSEVSVTAYRGDNLGGHFVLNGETRQDEIFGKGQPQNREF